jgi:hypothetical protein
LLLPRRFSSCIPVISLCHYDEFPNCLSLFLSGVWFTLLLPGMYLFCKCSYVLDISSSYHCISFISFWFFYFFLFYSLLIFLAYLYPFQGGFAYSILKICRLYLMNVLSFLTFSLHFLHNTHLLLFLRVSCQ